MVRTRRGVVSKEAALAVAETLIKWFPKKELGSEKDLRSPYRTESLFRRVGFRKCATTTGKVEVPDAVKEKVGLSFYYDILQK